MSNRWIRAGLFVLGALWCADAAAQISRPAHSGAFGSADTGIAAAQNPAALAHLEGTELTGRFLFFYSESEFETTAASFSGAVTSTSYSDAAIPALYFTHKMNDRLGLGLSIFAPGGVGDSFPSDSPMRYLVEDWSLVYISVSPAAGYRVTERFSVGGAVNVNYTALNYEAKVFNGVGLGDGEVELEADDVTLGFQLGVLYEFTPRTRIGLAYRSPNDAQPEGEPDFSGLDPAREAMLASAGVIGADFKFDSKLPQIVGAGIYHEFGSGYAATFDVIWIDFSEYGITELTVDSASIEASDRDYQDIWAGAASLSKRFNDRWIGSVGAIYFSSGIDDEDRSFTFRTDELWGVGVGAEYDWTESFSVGLNLNSYFLGDAPVEATVPLLGSLQGEFTERVNVGLDLSLRWRF